VTHDLILETARRGEALGYDTIWLSDHTVSPLDERLRWVYAEAAFTARDHLWLSSETSAS